MAPPSPSPGSRSADTPVLKHTRRRLDHLLAAQPVAVAVEAEHVFADNMDRCVHVVRAVAAPSTTVVVTDAVLEACSGVVRIATRATAPTSTSPAAAAAAATPAALPLIRVVKGRVGRELSDHV